MAVILIFKCTEGAGVWDYNHPPPLSRFEVALINGKTRYISTITGKNRGL